MRLFVKSGIGVHVVPADMRERLKQSPRVLAMWNDLTPLARNEWICWVISVKKIETREKHLKQWTEQLLEGKRRPCCWPGCSHRIDR